MIKLMTTMTEYLKASQNLQCMISHQQEQDKPV